MEQRVEYKKPGWWKRIIYFVLIFVPLLFIMRYAAGFYGVSRGLGLLMRLELHDKQGEIGLMASKTLLNYVYSSLEKVALLNSPVSSGSLEDLKTEAPEVIAAYKISNGGSALIFDFMGDDSQSEILADTVVNNYKNASNYNTIHSLGYKTKKLEIVFAGERLLLFYIIMGEEIRPVIINPEVLKENIASIMSGMEETDPELYDQLLGRYPVKFAEIKIIDEDGEIFYSAGMSHGEGWDDILTHRLFGWEITVKYYPEDHKLETVKWADLNPTVIIIDFLVAAVMLILLGHFSPKLHGFSVRKPAKGGDSDPE